MSKRIAFALILAALLAQASSCSEGSEGSKQRPTPFISAPTGPGTVTGTHPAYASTVRAGDSLALSVFVSQQFQRREHWVTLTATVEGGSLSPAEAGFTRHQNG